MMTSLNEDLRKGRQDEVVIWFGNQGCDRVTDEAKRSPDKFGTGAPATEKE